MGLKHFAIQLADRFTGEAIITAGGTYVVCSQGSPDERAITDKDGVAASNPATMTRGMIEFWVADTVESVDIHGIAPGGQWFSLLAVKPSGPNEVYIDTGDRMQVARIPYSHADSTDATEKDTGFDLPDQALVLPGGVGIYIVDTDASETIDVGLLSTESGGDADGFINGLTIAGAAATKVATLTNGAATLGVLLSVQDSANAGDLVPEAHVIDGTAVSVSYTTSSGTDTGSGFIILPYILAA